MDDWGIDGEEYIAAVRAGATDPHGKTADELQDELDAFDREWSERLATLSGADLDEVAAGRMEVPPLPAPIESPAVAELRAEAAFAGRVKALHAQRARLEAEERELLAAQFQAMLDAPGDSATALRETASILAVELRAADRAVEQRLTDAWTTVTELPAAHAAHKEGRISTGHLRVIAQATLPLRLDVGASAADKARVESELLVVASQTTPGRLRIRAKRIVDRALTAPLQQRHDAARERREVWMVDAGEGMVDVGARVPALHGAAIFDRLTQAARAKPKDDPRTFDQHRADAFCELLLAGQVPEDLTGVSAITATISVTIPATELLRDATPESGNDDALAAPLRFPASLDGRVLVDASTIRALAADTATWERLFLHPVTGLPVTVDTYQPSRAQRRWLRARDGHCRWPGCANPVSRADVDHTRDFAKGGTTTLSNLAHLCRRHHTMKHATRWSVCQLADGVLEWTSPLGDIHRDEPEPQGPRFVDAHERTWSLPPGVAAPPGPDEPSWVYGTTWAAWAPDPPPVEPAA